MELRDGHAQLIKNNQGERVTRLSLAKSSNASQDLRNRIAVILEKVTDELAKVPMRPSIPIMTELVQALEPVVRMAKTVHDWGNDAPAGLVLMADLRQAPALPAPCVDVQAVQVPACGIDTPSGGMPSTTSQETMPQVEETATVQAVSESTNGI